MSELVGKKGELNEVEERLDFGLISIMLEYYIILGVFASLNEDPVLLFAANELSSPYHISR